MVSRTEFPSVIPPAILTKKSTRHRTDLPFWIPRWFRRHFKRWTGHVTVWICHFESLGDSVGILNGEPVRSLYRAVVLNPSLIPSVKITLPKPPRQRPAFFFNSERFPSVIQSVTNDGKCPSVVTDWITDGKGSVGNFDLKLSTEIVRR